MATGGPRPNTGMYGIRASRRGGVRIGWGVWGGSIPGGGHGGGTRRGVLPPSTMAAGRSSGVVGGGYLPAPASVLSTPLRLLRSSAALDFLLPLAAARR